MMVIRTSETVTSLTICLYDPRSSGAIAYEALAKELLARNKKKK